MDEDGVSSNWKVKGPVSSMQTALSSGLGREDQLGKASMRRLTRDRDTCHPFDPVKRLLRQSVQDHVEAAGC